MALLLQQLANTQTNILLINNPDILNALKYCQQQMSQSYKTTQQEPTQNTCQKKILLLDGVKRIRQARQTDEPATLNSIIPLEPQPTIQQSASIFSEKLSALKKGKFESKDILMALLGTHSDDVTRAMIFFTFINTMLVYYGVIYALFFDSFFRKQYSTTFAAVFYLSLGIFINNLLTTNGYNQVGNLTVKMKGTLFYQMYKHILAMPSSLLRPEMQGNVISILTEFQYLMEESAYTTFRTFTCPIAVIGLCILLVYRHGFLTLITIFLCTCFQIVHVMMANRNCRFLITANELKDKRNASLSDIVYYLKYIKMQMWQTVLLKRARTIRKEEVDQLQKYSLSVNLEVALGEGIAFMSFIITLAALNVFARETITIEIAYTIVFFILMVRRLSSYITAGITNYYAFYVLFEGVATVLNNKSYSQLPSIEDDQRQRQTETERNTLSAQNIAVKMENVRFSYQAEEESKQLIFDNLNLTIKKGQFVVLMSKVGCGKTTLLDLISSQLQPTSGKVITTDEMSYVLSEPILFEGTVRHNIVLDHYFNQMLYESILEDCCLTDDLAYCPDGDLTIIQENARNLSGGQKARIALARALYSQKPILLLNDPFSYFDVRIGQKIVDNLSRISDDQGLTIIMVVHNSFYIKENNRILFIQNKGVIQVNHGNVESIERQSIERGSLKMGTRSSVIRQTLMPRTKKLISLVSESDEQQPENYRPMIKQVYKKEKGLEKAQFFKLFFKYFFISKANWLLFPFTVFLYAVSEALSAYISNFLLYQFTITARSNKTFLHDYGKLYVIIAVSIFILLLIRTFFLNWCIQNSNKKIFKDALDSLVFASMDSYRTQSSGSALDKVTQDIGMLDSNLFTNIDMEFIMFFQCLYNLGMMVLFKFVFIAFGILIVVSSYFVYAYCAPAVLSQRKLSLNLKGTPILNKFTEMLKSHKAIKIYGLQGQFQRRLEKVLMDSKKAVLSYHKTLLTFKFYNQNILNIAELAFLWFTVRTLLYEQVGIFCSSLISLFGIFLYFDWMLCESIVINNVLTCMERLLQFTQQKRTVEQRTIERESTNDEEKLLPHRPFSDSEFAIKIKNLNVKDFGRKHILKNIDIDIRKGQKIAVIGRSGSGKSIFIQALYKLIKAEQQLKYEIFDQDVNNLTLGHLRSYFECITQFPYIFQHSIRKNIDPFGTFTDQQIKQALKDVKMLEVVEASKEGINSSIQNKQIELSYGQRQLITMARIVIRKTPIVIMDEATSNLDDKTDGIIQSVIRKKLHGVTVINVTKNIANILDYDQILVFDHGEIVERGTSKELLQAKGQFHDIMAENKAISRLSSLYLEKQLSRQSKKAQ